MDYKKKLYNFKSNFHNNGFLYIFFLIKKNMNL